MITGREEHVQPLWARLCIPRTQQYLTHRSSVVRLRGTSCSISYIETGCNWWDFCSFIESDHTK